MILSFIFLVILNSVHVCTHADMNTGDAVVSDPLELESLDFEPSHIDAKNQI